MLAMSTNDLALNEIWLSSDPETARLRVDFPINNSVGSESTAVVYFEIEPGHRLAEHTDSAEELLYVVAGDAEARVGDERGRLTAGDLAVIPAMVPHGVRNVGDTRLKVVGFFSESKIVSTFDEPVQPIGLATLEMGAPAPAAA